LANNEYRSASTTFELEDRFGSGPVPSEPSEPSERTNIEVTLVLDDGHRHLVRVEIFRKYLVPRLTSLEWQRWLSGNVDTADVEIDVATFPFGPSGDSWSGYQARHTFGKSENIPHGWPSKGSDFRLAEKNESPYHFLGKGGFGSVFKVYCQGHRMALKRVSCGSGRERKNILREIKTMMRLQPHKHVLRYVDSYDREESDVMNVLIWPVCRCSLRDLLEKPTKDMRRALGIESLAHASGSSIQDATAQYLRSLYGCIIKGLEHLHNSEITHHDFKPDNILLRNCGTSNPQGTAFISDLGLSNDFSRDHNSKTAGPPRGTERYFSPELQKRKLRGRDSDIYAAGIVFVETETIIAGKNLDDLHNLIWKNIGKPSSLRSWIDKNIPDSELSVLLEGMLAERARDRWNVSSVSEELYTLGGTEQWYHAPCCKYESPGSSY